MSNSTRKTHTGSIVVGSSYWGEEVAFFGVTGRGETQIGSTDQTDGGTLRVNEHAPILTRHIPSSIQQ